MNEQQQRQQITDVIGNDKIAMMEVVQCSMRDAIICENAGDKQNADIMTARAEYFLNIVRSMG